MLPGEWFLKTFTRLGRRVLNGAGTRRLPMAPGECGPDLPHSPAITENQGRVRAYLLHSPHTCSTPPGRVGFTDPQLQRQQSCPRDSNTRVAVGLIGKQGKGVGGGVEVLGKRFNRPGSCIGRRAECMPGASGDGLPEVDRGEDGREVGWRRPSVGREKAGRAGRQRRNGKRALESTDPPTSDSDRVPVGGAGVGGETTEGWVSAVFLLLGSAGRDRGEDFYVSPRFFFQLPVSSGRMVYKEVLMRGVSK
ncbi:hypothetical protein KSP40_PGU019943 [Platanthera guangdongensis]|uniref:Uncharacterized protein n=1 Tax=Platanthera guangdongensis TaxID=2320717 RepID=A0ABR2MJP8_9ASPA